MDEPPLTPLARVLLWDYGRLSLPYLLLCLAILALVLIVPSEWLGDPMVAGR
jgi:hypothetical protein